MNRAFGLRIGLELPDAKADKEHGAFTNFCLRVFDPSRS
jgi:hypothetical protein